jgi:hypothetical protein
MKLEIIALLICAIMGRRKRRVDTKEESSEKVVEPTGKRFMRRREDSPYELTVEGETEEAKKARDLKNEGKTKPEVVVPTTERKFYRKQRATK